MKKDFDLWNIKKKSIDISDSGFLFHEGEIWWCMVGVNIGEESCGKGNLFMRPVFILRKLSRKNFIGIPVSTKTKIGTWFVSVLVNNMTQTFLLYQMRMFSSNRLQRRLVNVPRSDVIKIKEKIKSLLNLF